MTPAPHERHLRVQHTGITMTPGIPVQSKIAEVDGVGHGSRNSIAQRRAAVVRSLSPTQPFERPRGRERERWRWPAARWRCRAAAKGGGARGVVFCSPLLGPPLYIGGGVHPCPSPKAPRAAAKGERRAAPAGVGEAKPAPPKP
jgi:hypothetical protein